MASPDFRLDVVYKGGGGGGGGGGGVLTGDYSTCARKTGPLNTSAGIPLSSEGILTEQTRVCSWG